ncbi:MAG: hypothetical protein ACKVJE_06590 [Pseudomonadales bacterium]
MKMTWVVLAIIVMAGFGYWNWQKGQEQLKILKSSGFDITEDLKGEPRLVIDRTNKSVALVSANNYRVIPMEAITSSKVLYDRGVQMDENFRIELQLAPSESAIVPIVYENETLARAALNSLQSAIR